MSLPTEPYRGLFDAIAHMAGLPRWRCLDAGVWLEAVAMTESSGNPRARHYDQGHDAKDFGSSERWASYGLFQIEGETARSLLGNASGVQDFTFLFLPAINTALAVRILSENLETYNGSVDRALAAYNGGRWGATTKADGDLNDQAYVDRVIGNAALVAADRG